jgi:hypothetical protein
MHQAREDTGDVMISLPLDYHHISEVFAWRRIAHHRLQLLKKYNTHPTQSNTMSKGSELGTLIVVVLKARNLIDKHSFYKQDVYAQASLNGRS